MKRIVIIIVAVLLLAGLAVGGLYMGGFIFAAPEEAAAEEPAPEPTLPELPAVVYFELGNVILPAYRGGQFRNYINFVFRIEVADEATVEKLRDRTPHMRAALVADFSVAPIETEDGPADFDDATVRARVLAALRRATGKDAAGEDIVRGVLIDRVLPIRG
ncbi:hypothetical protein L2U69_02320 [Zavarzinia compransoris]|uniref:hypothetical protein n=1 Tax=Zavarzinia marina TaxID=2911065 RepID=UPI001F25B1B5|nr:hypothetical protein [Zavarzinia marina]MCF4164482.1 hypothetical protein [Zavarzinia marina]